MTIFIIFVLLFNFIKSQEYDPNLATTLCSYSITSMCNQHRIEKWSCGVMCTEHPEIVEVKMMFNKTGGISGFMAYNTQRNAIVASFRGTLPYKILYKFTMNLNIYLFIL